MNSKTRVLLFIVAIIVTATSLPMSAQLATVNVGVDPFSAGINSTTNQVYVANQCGNDPNCMSTGTVSVIDGGSFGVQTITMNDYFPFFVATNPITNKIYVGTCSVDPGCFSTGSLLVIDGATMTTQDVPVGIYTWQIAVNPVTNKIYVVNNCGTDINCASTGTVTVVDGATLATQQVTVGVLPIGVAVNSVTNKIYVVNNCGDDTTCQSNGTVTVIDGATNATQSVAVDFFPAFAAVNSVTNQIYVANNGGTDGTGAMGTVTVIDGATNNTQTVAVGVFPTPITVNAVTNQIYVGNRCGSDINCMMPPSVSVIDGTTLTPTTVSICTQDTFPADDIEVDTVTNKVYLPCNGRPPQTTGMSLTILDGATNNTSSVTVGDFPVAAVVDAPTNRVFVPNSGDNNVDVLAGASGAPLQFVNLTPCRVVDTRPSGPLLGGMSQSYVFPGNCSIPTNAAAYSVNVTVVPRGPLGYLTIWPTGEDQPVVSTLNAPDGRVKANAAIVPAGYQGALSVFVTDTTDVILDIDGYFAAPGQQTYQFYPLTPCRVVDTRGAVGDLGGPFLTGMMKRDFPVRESTTCIPQGATIAAYSMNFSVVPHMPNQPLGYLTVWPQGQDQPVVSTLNNPTGTVVANAAIVPAGNPNGGISTFAYDDTDLFIDINGYFGPPGQSGVSFYPAAPCRAFDTRAVGSGQPFVGVLSPPVNVVGGPCAPPSAATAFVLNATVVPAGGPMGFLTLWPDGQQQQPVVSTLNAYDGFITSNMAIVPSINGSIDAYADGLTQLILDISGYFAPEQMMNRPGMLLRSGTGAKAGTTRQHGQVGRQLRRGHSGGGATIVTH